MDGNLIDRITINRVTKYNIEGKLKSDSYVVGFLNVDAPTTFITEVFKDYKQARKFIREKYKI